MRRLYLQVYLTIVASSAPGRAHGRPALALRRGRSPVRSRSSSRASSSPSLFLRRTRRARLRSRPSRRLAQRLGGDLALFSADKQPLAAAGRPLPPPANVVASADGCERRGPRSRSRSPTDAGWSRACRMGSVPARPAGGFLEGHRARRGRRPADRAAAPDGSSDCSAASSRSVPAICARASRSRPRRSPATLKPIRPPARIESLVDAHKLLLANASHELRTPLTRQARSRAGRGAPERRQALARGIAELDQLVEEILLLSRLDATERLDVRESRPGRARGRGMRALRGLQRRRTAGDRAGT